MQHWPWWGGALALAVVAVAHTRVIGRPLGVSSALKTAFDPAARRDEREAAAFASERERDEALYAATLAEFGPEAVAGLPAPSSSSTDASSNSNSAAPPLGFSAAAVFCVCLVAGGFLAAVSSGTWQPTLLDADLVAFFHGDAGALAAVVGGGLLVGFGTQMAGGCTSGHGLIGCATLQPGSLLATASFFGTAILVMHLLAGALS